MNVDTHYRSDSDGRSFSGLILRGSDGNAVGAGTRVHEGVQDALMAEAYGLLDALLYAEQHHLTHIIFELDSLYLVNLVQSDRQIWKSWGYVVRRCRGFLHENPNSAIKWIGRNGNRVADALAKWAAIEPNMDWTINKVKLNYPPQFYARKYVIDFFRILGSAVNGMLCVYDWHDHKNFVLWNPTTNEIKVVPHVSDRIKNSKVNTVTLHGFGYDQVRDDYKVIQHVNYDGVRHDSFWEIYSLKSNSWVRLGFGGFDIPIRYVSAYGNVYMNGMCHWLGDDKIEGKCVVSFNLSKEMFFITPLPFMCSCFDDDNMHVLNNLFVLNGHFTMITYHKKTTTKSFHISILGEFGVKESWVRLFDIGPLSCIEQPIGAGKNNVFFKKEDGELVCFNLTTGMIEEIGVKGGRCRCQMMIYKKNLHPIGGKNS
ncbi:F-box protein [Trifolium medium]|uniref:F-box protein n=1 Tax=Trifolium medium TaxID=97028 RepID=A0A392M0A5_9FABA|nr:F-box protein [Trifolium medium]